MNKTLTAARQIVFDTQFARQVKKLESLASPGSHATFEGEDNALAVTFHGHEVETRRRFELPCAAPFSFTVRGKDITDILKNFGEGTMTVRKTSLSFKSGHTRMNRSIAVDVSPPAFPDFSGAALSPLPQTAFRDAAFASYAAAQGGESDAAERVSILLAEGGMSIVATNSLMAVCVATPLEYAGGQIEYLLHPRFINPLAPLTMEEDAPGIYIGSTKSKYLIRFGEYEITSRKPTAASIRGDVARIMELVSGSPSSMTAALDSGALKVFLDRAKLLDVGATQVKPAVLLADPEERVVYAKHASSLGNIQDMLEAEVEGAAVRNMPVGLSLKYLSEVCSRVRAGMVRMTFRGKLSPVTVTEEIGDTVVTHILLPVRPGAEQFEPAAGDESAQSAESPAGNRLVRASDFDEED